MRPFPSSGATAGASIEATTSAALAGGFFARLPSRPPRLRAPAAFFLVPPAFFLLPPAYFLVPPAFFLVVFRARVAGPRDSRSRRSSTASSRFTDFGSVPRGIVAFSEPSVT